MHLCKLQRPGETSKVGRAGGAVTSLRFQQSSAGAQCRAPVPTKQAVFSGWVAPPGTNPKRAGQAARSLPRVSAADSKETGKILTETLSHRPEPVARKMGRGRVT